MPVDPNNIYADKAHDKTIQAAGWTYGCHSDKTGPDHRGEASKIEVQEGWTDDGRRVMRPHVTEWKALHLDDGQRYAVARVELSEPKPSGEGVNHEAIKTLNDARREAQP